MRDEADGVLVTGLQVGILGWMFNVRLPKEYFIYSVETVQEHLQLTPTDITDILSKAVLTPNHPLILAY